MLSQHEFFSANSSRAVVAYILASKSPQPNAYGAKIPVSSQLNISVWRHYLTDYVDHIVVDFLQFGWPQFSTFTRRQLQSLLGKLSFVTACIRPGRIFMSRLLNRLRSLPSKPSRFPVTSDMLPDIDWWLTFLPHFNGSTMIVLRSRDFHDVLFTCDSSLHRGGATCFDECTSFAFPRDIEELALHINALELFVLVMAVKIWAPKLAGSRFQISCDNDAAVQVVRSGRTRDAFMQRCLRQLWLTSARYDLDLHVSHIPGVHNVFADCLSRWDADSTFQRKFHELASQRNLCFHMLSIDSEDLAFDLS